jgi:hypothetical protein
MLSGEGVVREQQLSHGLGIEKLVDVGQVHPVVGIVALQPLEQKSALEPLPIPRGVSGSGWCRDSQHDSSLPDLIGGHCLV